MPSSIPKDQEKLPKTLGLFDVYAIATGAMFSSGFFLLPGLAAAATGPSVVLAYLLASILMIPALLSMAELATAMPKAGGAYFFLDRSMGPAAGTVGGLGSWVALVLKSAFALVGMGAYLAFFIDVPVIPLAIALTLVFGAINFLGAKETAGLQNFLVAAIVVILTYFVIDGLYSLTYLEEINWARPFGQAWFSDGLSGFMSTIGLVFVSYAGLTKVASVAEEVQNPSRNIPLGMILSLVSTTFIYVAGVLLMILLIEPDALYSDLTPVATAVSRTNNLLPAGIALGLVVVAALSAFASTGNAGIMAASRYLLAMARDNLVTERFSRISSRGTPYWAIAFTVLVMIGVLILIDVEQIAKLASAFQLLLFGLLNLAVIIMRESRIKTYDPGFRSPFYPALQTAGILIPVWLIAEMGAEAVLFTGTLAILALFWYLFYASARVDRRGAIFHWHARLGRRKSEHIEEELRLIVKEQGLRKTDDYERMISQAMVLEYDTLEGKDNGKAILHQVFHWTAARWADRLDLDEDRLVDLLKSRAKRWDSLTEEILLAHWGVSFIDAPQLIIVRSKTGMSMKNIDAVDYDEVHALFLMLYPQQDHGAHLRTLGHLATFLDQADFLASWLAALDDNELRKLLLRDDHYLVIEISEENRSTASWIGQPLKNLSLPPETLIATIHRRSSWLIPRGDTTLKNGDMLTVIGQPDDIDQLRKQVTGAVHEEMPTR